MIPSFPAGRSRLLFSKRHPFPTSDVSPFLEVRQLPCAPRAHMSGAGWGGDGECRGLCEGDIEGEHHQQPGSQAEGGPAVVAVGLHPRDDFPGDDVEHAAGGEAHRVG